MPIKHILCHIAVHMVELSSFSKLRAIHNLTLLSFLYRAWCQGTTIKSMQSLNPGVGWHGKQIAALCKKLTSWEMMLWRERKCFRFPVLEVSTWFPIRAAVADLPPWRMLEDTFLLTLRKLRKYSRDPSRLQFICILKSQVWLGMISHPFHSERPRQWNLQ